MDKLNINNLFNQNSPNLSNSSNNFDIYSLFNNSHDSDSFTIDSLIQKKKNLSLSLKSEYKKYLKLALTHIQHANNSNLFSITFNVPFFSFHCPNYNYIDCIHFIIRRLNKINIDASFSPPNSIYISWFNIDKSS